ncbi:hypothetical protein McaMca56_008160 [Microsporum canis]
MRSKMPLSKPKSRPNKDVKPKRLDDTHGRQADVKYPLDLISLNGPSKTTTTARFKITKSKKETEARERHIIPEEEHNASGALVVCFHVTPAFPGLRSPARLLELQR